MLPLLLLLAGGAITAYAFSPKVKTRVDMFVRSIRSADAAHEVADEKLSRANEATAALQVTPQPSMDPWAVPAGASQSFDLVKAQEAINRAVDYLAEADKANRAAAGQTGVAAVNAGTPEQRQQVAQSANKVLERKDQIDEALRTLGVGSCDVKTYERVTPQAKDALLARLSAEGMTVTGDNPWDIDTNTAGVKLRAVWDSRSNVLKLIVSDKWRIAPCDEVWKRIDPKMKEVVGAWNAWR